MGNDHDIPDARRKVGRSAPGAKSTYPIVPPPPSAIIILDKPGSDNDSFTLRSSKGKAQTKATSQASAVNATHDQIRFRVKNSKYTLVQQRGAKSKHTIFKDVQRRFLTLAKAPPPIQHRNYYPLDPAPPKTNDPDLLVEAVNYNAPVDEPDTN